MTHREDIVQEIKDWTAFRLANEADCHSPDTHESAGATLLMRVRDNTLEALEDVGTDDLDSIDDNGTISEIADGAPSIYTYTRFQEFTDLAAWQEDVTDFGPIEDMEKAAGVALYMIADRLAHVIVDAVREAAEEDDNEVTG